MKAGLAESDDPAPDRNWWPEVVDHVVGLSLLPFFKRREEQRPHRVELENMELWIRVPYAGYTNVMQLVIC